MGHNTFDGLSIKACTTYDEACEQFGFNREVEGRPLTYLDANGNPLVSPFHRQVVYTDNDIALGVVGLRYGYTPVYKAFAMAEPLLERGAGVVAGGCPNRGERAYLILESPEFIKVGQSKILNRYTLITSHDGTSKIEVRITPFDERTRVVFTPRASTPLTFKHTLKVGDRLGQAHRTYKTMQQEWAAFSDGVQRMVTVNLTDTEARDFVVSVLGNNDSTRMDNLREDVYQIWKNTGVGTRVPGVRGTLFGMVQAFTEWADMHRTVRKSSRRDEQSAALDARLVSDSAKKKMKAWSVALNVKKLSV